MVDQGLILKKITVSKNNLKQRIKKYSVDSWRNKPWDGRLKYINYYVHGYIGIVVYIQIS